MGNENSIGPLFNSASIERESLLANLLNSANDLVWCTSVDGSELLYVNPVAERIYGRKLAELKANPGLWIESIHPDDRDRVQKSLEELLELRQIEQEYRIVRPDGVVVWLQDRVTVVYDDDGQPLYVGGIGTDVSAVRESDALYHSLVENLPLNVLRKDISGKIVFGNQRYCNTIGAPLEDLVGKTDFDLFPEELAKKYTEDDRKVIATGQVLNDIEKHQTSTGEHLYVEVFKGPTRDSHGRIVGTQVMFWDVTERKLAEELLERERDLMRTLMDHIPDWIFIKDAEGRFVTANRSLVEFFGLASVESLVGKTDFDFMEADMAARYEQDDLAVVRSGHSLIDREEVGVGPNGQEFCLLTSKIPFAQPMAVSRA